jgi:hypothetical protein
VAAILSWQWLVRYRMTSVDEASANNVATTSQLAAACGDFPCMAVACSVRGIAFNSGASCDYSVDLVVLSSSDGVGLVVCLLLLRVCLVRFSASMHCI